MTFSEETLQHGRPGSIRTDVALPRQSRFYPSPADWRDEVIYFLLVDRFSDGGEGLRPALDRKDLDSARPALPTGELWGWDRWAFSGASRWQGGTLRGVASKLGYLKRLGVTTLWLSPVFKQRGHLDTYHGYGVQDFLDVDPHFGDRRDLVDLVAEAHAEGLRVILDIIFNHSGQNWLYPPGTSGGVFTPFYTTNRYPFGAWCGIEGQTVGTIGDPEEGVWPTELQNKKCYTRAGTGNLGAGDIDDPNAEHKRSDFFGLRDFQLAIPEVLSDLARSYKYWMALTDCDGFRIDTLKHVSFEEARNFCGTLKEFAANLGKSEFLLIGEVAGGEYNEDRYLDVLERNLDAALDIGEMRLALARLAKGLTGPKPYFDGFDPGGAPMGSHRNLGKRHVSVLDDHDNVSGEKIRFSANASSDHQVATGVALQLFTLGIPCIYYGTEQALAGPELLQRTWLPDWGTSDRYLREAMFGPANPRRAARAGLGPGPEGIDAEFPGFGAFGTAGHHCFVEAEPAYVRIAASARLRKEYPVLRQGRQYPRPISLFGHPFGLGSPGEIVAWSRILDDEEALCVLNSHGTQARGADVLVDAALSPPGASMTVILNTAHVANASGFAGSLPIGSRVPVQRTPDGKAYVEIRNVDASEVVLLTNHPASDIG